MRRANLYSNQQTLIQTDGHPESTYNKGDTACSCRTTATISRICPDLSIWLLELAAAVPSNRAGEPILGKRRVNVHFDTIKSSTWGVDSRPYSQRKSLHQGRRMIRAKMQAGKDYCSHHIRAEKQPLSSRLYRTAVCHRTCMRAALSCLAMGFQACRGLCPTSGVPALSLSK